MNIIAVDDEIMALGSLLQHITATEPLSQVSGFSSAVQALQYAQQHEVNLAFLDIELAGASGLALAQALIARQKNCRIIFVTAYPQYAVEAFRMHACGYLLKPVSAQVIAAEMERLRYPMPPLGQRAIRVQTFGNLEVFTDAGAVKFSRRKAKELLAYLVDRRGAGCASREIAAVLWEDRPYDATLKNYVQRVISDLMASLRNAAAQAMLQRKWNSLSVDTRTFKCDYYNLLDGSFVEINAFQGEYMSNYSWAEATTAYLCSRKPGINRS